MATAQIDRRTTTPFLLRLFYRTGSFPPLNDFSTGGHLPPQQLQIYTWPNCSLRELTSIVHSAIPQQFPSPAVGTRISFRLVFPDTKPSSTRPGEPGRYMTKDLGSVVVGSDPDSNGDTVMNSTSALDGDAEKTLQDARFIIGDYIACAILPPLSNGSVAPPLSRTDSAGFARGGYGNGAGRGGAAGARDAYPGRRDGFGGPRENGFGEGHFGGGRGGRGGYPGGRDDFGRGSPGGNVPLGEWRRGEQVPYSGGYGRGRGRRGGY